MSKEKEQNKYGWNDVKPVAKNKSLVSELKTFKSGATRSEDAESERFDLISPFALQRIAVIFAEGANSHGENNWELGVPIDVTLNHLERHLQMWKAEKKSGEKIGEPSEDHLAKVAWGIMAIMHYEHPSTVEANYGSLKPHTEILGFKGK